MKLHLGVLFWEAYLEVVLRHHLMLRYYYLVAFALDFNTLFNSLCFASGNCHCSFSISVLKYSLVSVNVLQSQVDRRHRVLGENELSGICECLQFKMRLGGFHECHLVSVNVPIVFEHLQSL